MSTYHVTVNGKAYIVSVPDPTERPVRAIVNDEVIYVQVEDTSNRNLTEVISSGPSKVIQDSEPQVKVVAEGHPSHLPAQASVALKSLRSPLPGIIVSISVVEGDRVEPGQELCVLEAMKMNNPIRSTLSGNVDKIYITVGQQVQHNVPLMAIKV
ncbi:MAG: biotin/lipoyl-binding protein [Anaerolineae bacterium]|nr:biotin/lipoyl-binding protein [Anaerolineae bacterium]